MKILFFDTETNGLPRDYRASYTAVDNWPRVVQLAWILCDHEGQILNQQSHLIKPDGWVMPTEDFWVKHNLTQARSEQDGRPIVEVLQELMVDKQAADFLVAHNINFDHRITWAEYIRAGMEPKSGMTKICTMQKSTPICRIPGKRGLKWPTLEEAYRHFFNIGVGQAHDAGADVMACKEIFFELLRRGHLTLTDPSNFLLP